jgi:hypothetical protein
MFRRITALSRALLILLLVVGSATTASASTIRPDGEPAQPFAYWLTLSHAPAPPAQIVIDPGACPGEGSVWCAPPGRIFTYGSSLNRSGFYHELGHQFDYAAMTDVARTRFAAIFHRRYDPATYWQDVSRDRSLAEWFGEGYRLCALYAQLRSPLAIQVDVLFYDYNPSVRQQRRVCALISSVAGEARPTAAPRADAPR